MKILFVSAEVSPFAKVGGLADVAGSLPQALNELGEDVRVVMPLYQMIDLDPRWDLESEGSFDVDINPGWSERVVLKSLQHRGVRIYFVGHETFFRQATESETVYVPGIEQYLFFSAAVLGLPGYLGWCPEIVHCNDWHTGFIPALMREKSRGEFAGTGAIFTIHNLAYQGEFGIEILDKLALPRTLFVTERLETYGSVNFLKTGCVYSDQVNTVSPTYAREIQTPEFGSRLEGLMVWLESQGRLSGILNGIGTDEFDPATDARIPCSFSASDAAGKPKCRQQLLKRLGLPNVSHAPLVGSVTRLSSQKGLDMLAQAIPQLVDSPIQFVVQGLGDPNLASEFRELQATYPDNVAFVEQFDEAMARAIYAGCDVFAMPSLFEPCGLGQLIAMRYGAIPVVRATGGLSDTVFEGENGFVFQEKSAAELKAALLRARHAFLDRPVWQRMISLAMAGDYSWGQSASAYQDLYGKALASRPSASLAR